MVFYKMVLQKLDKFKIRCHNTISSADYDYWNTLECSNMMDQSLTIQDLNSSIFLFWISSLANLHDNKCKQINNWLQF
jgi:hypothetical protein